MLQQSECWYDNKQKCIQMCLKTMVVPMPLNLIRTRSSRNKHATDDEENKHDNYNNARQGMM